MELDFAGFELGFRGKRFDRVMGRSWIGSILLGLVAFDLRIKEWELTRMETDSCEIERYIERMKMLGLEKTERAKKSNGFALSI